MKNSYFLVINFVILFLGLSIWYIYVNISQISALAQTTNCPPYLLDPGSENKWLKGNAIRLRIHSAFTATERQSIINAFNEWNNHRTINCSDVTFNTNPANIVIADRQATSESEIRFSHWIEFDPSVPSRFVALTSPTSRPSGATTVYGYIRRQEYSDPAWLKGVMMHEIGIPSI